MATLVCWASGTRRDQKLLQLGFMSNILMTYFTQARGQWRAWQSIEWLTPHSDLPHPLATSASLLPRVRAVPVLAASIRRARLCHEPAVPPWKFHATLQFRTLLAMKMPHYCGNSILGSALRVTHPMRKWCFGRPIFTKHASQWNFCIGPWSGRLNQNRPTSSRHLWG